jgi:CPA2 family monovalent cation:H+ antiporter-2
MEVDSHQFIQDLMIVLGSAGIAGWICQRLKISVIVGYLVSGILIGPFTPLLPLVSKTASVQTLSELGLIFVMFFIGLELSLTRLKKLGATVVVTTLIETLFFIIGARIISSFIGLTVTQSLFIAGILMFSSSAIVSKLLQELDLSKEKFGRLALSVIIMEDLVAIILLTILSSLVSAQASESIPLLHVTGKLAGFILLILLLSLLLVPKILSRLHRNSSFDVQTICVMGLLLVLGWISFKAGYSLVLGAFLLGTIISGTPHKTKIVHTFESFRDVFGAIFFVSMGMLIDFQLLWSAWPWILIISAVALIGRSMITSLGFFVSGQPTKVAFQAGMALTPVGEFSFVIAQLGVASGIMPKTFYPTAVGVSMVTTFIAPLLIRNGTSLANLAEQYEPTFLREMTYLWPKWIENSKSKKRKTSLWKMLFPRLLQLSLEIAIIISLLLFSKSLYSEFLLFFDSNTWLEGSASMFYWSLLGLVILIPAVAIWRNIEVLSMVLAEFFTSSVSKKRASFQPFLERLIQGVGFLFFLLICIPCFPEEIGTLWKVITVLGVTILLALLLWPKYIKAHSYLRIELLKTLSAQRKQSSKALKTNLLNPGTNWDLRLHELTLSDLSEAAGKAVRDLPLKQKFGCSLVGIERQGIPIFNPSPDSILYPNDILLLVGQEEQLEAAEKWLSSIYTHDEKHEFSEAFLHEYLISDHFKYSQLSLAELELGKKFGVLVVAIRRKGENLINPPRTEFLISKDIVLVLGVPPQHKEFQQWLES